MAEAIDGDELTARLRETGYLADRGLAMALALAIRLRRALLLEGDAGVGKTEAARALAASSGAELIRLQCYEGIDLATAAYDWNYGKQLLAIRRAEALHESPPDLYDETFLLRRPLLRALESTRDRDVVLLIDEIDRADDEFEAFLLEFLQDYAISIPELGRIAAHRPPVVILTSNRTRDLHDALKRRCFYHWLPYPPVDREVEILRARVPEVPASLSLAVARAVEALRNMDLRKPPGIAEAIDWAQSLAAVGADRIDGAALDATLGAVLKYPEDLELARARRSDLIA